MIESAERLPASILTGFLGSGKTTLLNRLLRHEGMTNTAVIVNEFGEVGLDHLLVEAPDETTVLMDSGCLCCTILGDLVQTLQNLLAKRITGTVPAFERVVIETTGLADPASILQTLIADQDITKYYVLDSVITVIDAINGASQFDTHFESVKQAAVADHIVVSKTDLVGESDLDSLLARLTEINPGADIHRAVMGGIEPAKLFGAGTADKNLSQWLDTGTREYGHGHHHDDNIHTFTLSHDAPIDPTGMQLWLDLLASYRGPNLLRVKGLLNVAGQPVVVHAVQHLFHQPVALDDWPDEDRSSRIIFITHGIAREDIIGTLEALDFKPVGPTDGLSMDPQNYARFLSVVKRFENTSG